jgi:hypothetical protein
MEIDIISSLKELGLADQKFSLESESFKFEKAPAIYSQKILWALTEKMQHLFSSMNSGDDKKTNVLDILSVFREQFSIDFLHNELMPFLMSHCSYKKNGSFVELENFDAIESLDSGHLTEFQLRGVCYHFLPLLSRYLERFMKIGTKSKEMAQG